MSAPNRTLSVRAVVALYREFELVARASDLSIAQYRLLLYLRDGPKRAGEIAAAGELAKPTVSLKLNALRKHKWIANAPDIDGRAAKIVLTDAGQARMAAFEAKLAATLDGALGGSDLAAFHTGAAAAYAAMGATKEDRLRTVERQMTG